MEVDVAVVGAGTAGMSAYRAAVRHTDRVLLIESGPYGTTCARVGCMPSKLLIAAAEAAHAAEAAGVFGVHAGPVRVDGRAVMARVRAERDRFVGFVLDDVHAWPARHKLRGRARFRGPNVLAVGDEVVHARATVIAAGSRPKIPEMFADLGDRLVVNDDVFSWDDLPGSVAVFGPGVIGLELGQALHRLGVRVRIFGRRGGIGPLVDPVIRPLAESIFAAELPLCADAHVTSVRRTSDGVAVSWRAKDADHTESFDLALVAVGRAPNVDDLGLETTGLALDAFGVPVFDRTTMQCGESPIFLAGDVDDELPILHEAADEGRIAGENAARFPDVRPGHRRTPMGIVFTDPQIGICGQRCDELDDPVVGRVSFANQGRSRVMAQNRGALHVYADRATGRLLGAELVGPRAEHLTHLLAWAHQQQLTIDELLAMPFYHPVIEEGLRTALRDAASQLANKEKR